MPKTLDPTTVAYSRLTVGAESFSAGAANARGAGHAATMTIDHMVSSRLLKEGERLKNQLCPGIYTYPWGDLATAGGSFWCNPGVEA
jgi:hypothetical protein